MTEANNGSLAGAMLAVQAEAPTLQKDGRNPAFGGSRYATLHTVVETIRPKLVEHGLLWTTLPTTNEHGQPALRYRLEHVSTGKAIEDTAPLLLGKVDSQGLGSALTYMRRYTLCAVLNLVADDDDDGNAAAQGAVADPVSRRGAPTDKQLAFLRRLATQNNIQNQPASLKAMLTEVGAEDVDITGKWTTQLNRDQVSALIDIFQTGTVPAPDQQDIPSDLPEPLPDGWDDAMAKARAQSEAPGA